MLTIVLLTASVSVTRAFLHLMQTDRGFATKGLITVSVSLDGTAHQLAARRLPYFEEALAGIRRLPHVRSASATDVLPLYAINLTGGPFGIDGRPPKATSLAVPVLPDYFQTMGTTVLCGREFSAAEVRSDAKVAVVSEGFAREFGSPAEALGHLVTIGNMPPRKIVGVAKGMDYMSPDVSATQVFFPAHAPAANFFSTFVVRVNGEAQNPVASIRDVIRSIDPTVPVFGASTMQRRLEDALAHPKFYRTSLLFFAGFALLLSIIGIYGVVAYAVTQRTRELGIRLALGATPTRLRGTLLTQELFTVVTGALCGILGAVFTGRLLQTLVEGAKGTNSSALLYAPLFICLIAALSIWTATRRIARLDVTEILRAE
jgi:ABC-type antimicrobial peptide transport system permease subunit